jgi:hypothetical protein
MGPELSMPHNSATDRNTTKLAAGRMGPLMAITATYAIYAGPSSFLGNRWSPDPARGLRGPPSTSPTQVVDSPGPTDIASKGGPPLMSPTHVVASPGPTSTAS